MFSFFASLFENICEIVTDLFTGERIKNKSKGITGAHSYV